MTTLLSQKESEAKPYVPNGCTSELDVSGPIWQRIDEWIAYRWGPRSVEWVVEGPGDWIPPLTPYEIDQAEIWGGESYEATDLKKGPLGLVLGDHTYRVKATVGNMDYPPGIVIEAWRRMVDYLTEGRVLGLVSTKASVTANNVVPVHRTFSRRFVTPPPPLQGEGVNGPGRDVSEEYERPRDWQSRALFYSGAADLLRQFRRP